METNCNIREYLENLMTEYPICEYAFGSTDMITFSDKVYEVCRTDCPRYGHRWACPPNAGSIEDNIERIGHYDSFLLFSTVWDVDDAWDFEACFHVKKEHEIISRSIREKLLDHCRLPMESLAENPAPEIYMLSSGCDLCDDCSCPDKPCRHPKERLMTPESHGILIVKLAEDTGLTLKYDNKTVVYFTMVFFNDSIDYK